MKMQPSHRLFCPHPWPRPRLPFPQPTPTGRSLSRPRPEAAPARNPAGRLDAGMPRSRSSGTDPRVGLRSPERNGDALDGYNPRQGPKKYPECPDRGGGAGVRLPSVRENTPVCHRDPCPPAATELPVTFPPNALPIQTHTNTPIPCAAASRGGDLGEGGGEESVWETRERASLSGRKSCSGETLPTYRRPRDSHGEGFQHPLEIERC